MRTGFVTDVRTHPVFILLAKNNQGFPSLFAQTCAKGTVCLFLVRLKAGDQGERKWGEGQQQWDCESPALSTAWRGQAGYPPPTHQ